MLLVGSSPQTGVALALCTATFWAISPMFMASVGRQIGSLHTNFLRVLIASAVLACGVLPMSLWLRGSALVMPTGAQLGWLAASAVAGMVVGDIFFYEALVLIGPRRAIKMNTLAPVFAMFLAYFVNREALSGRSMGGAALVIGAIMFAVFRQTTASAQAAATEPPRMAKAGFFCGLVAALCTGLGSVLTRQAYQTPAPVQLDPILATTIRVVTAGCVLWMWPLFRGEARAVIGHLRTPGLRLRLCCGIAGGPLAGMLCYISALKFAQAGLVSTLVASSPLITMPILALRYRVRIGWDIVAATAVAVAGVAVIMIR